MGQELFVELFCEELPASMVGPAVESLRDGLVGLLGSIEHGAARIYATPRHLAVAIADVAAGTPDVEKVMTGPAVAAAYDASGALTPAAVGFARGKGVDPSAIEVVDGPKGKVIAVRVKQGGAKTVDVLRAGLDALVRGIAFRKSMEWGNGGLRWGRPLHAVNVLYGGDVLEGTVAGLKIGNTTQGHRLAKDPSFSFRSSAEWVSGLRERAVIADPEERRARIVGLLAEMADGVGAERVAASELLDEVVNLVESPAAVLGTFDADLLELPPRLLVESMRVHQRYFPLFVDGALTNRFAVISNNPWGDADLIAEGNARVLRARFYDARYFFAADKKKSLDEHGKKLGQMRWIRGLGTMADKSARLGALASTLALRLAAGRPDVAQQAGYAGRAGLLAKADLVTQMVGEFPELQGHVGRLYASHQGEPDAVAWAIEDQYSPKGPTDRVPTSITGVALALADRLDTLVGCFGIGLVPKGSGDPQGLRRAAAGVLSIIETNGLRLFLPDLFRSALGVFQAHLVDVVVPEGQGADFDAWTKARGVDGVARDADGLVAELVEFTLTRFKASAVADGAPGDRVDAVLAVTAPDPVMLRAKVRAVERVAETADFPRILQTVKRVLNITAGKDAPHVRDVALTHDAERALFFALGQVERTVAAALVDVDVDAALAAALSLETPIAALFDAVMVEDPDPSRRDARVGLLLHAASIFGSVADFSRVSTR
jgi:glycyl-tRNA synthetase beta chain